MAGRTILNLQKSDDFVRDHPFVNLVKTNLQRMNPPGTVADLFELNADQYPTSGTKTFSQLFYFAGNFAAGTTLRCRWTGSGSVSINSADTFNPPDASGKTYTDGNFTFTVSAGRVNSVIGIKGTTMSNLQIFLESEKSLIDADEYALRPAFKNAMIAANPRALRFMDKMQTVRNFIATHADRKKMTMMNWSDWHYVPAKKIGANGLIATVDGIAYTAAAYAGMPAGPGYVHGETVQGYVTTTTVSGTPTLNVGSRGAKTIINEFGTAVGTDQGGGYTIDGTVPLTFIFDALMDKWYFRRWGVFDGWPLEAMIKICNECGIDPWFCIGPHWTEAKITSFLQAVKATLATHLSAWFEYGNEVWNTFGDNGAGTAHAQAHGKLAFPGISDGNYADKRAWYGLRSIYIGDQAAAIWAASPAQTNFKCIHAHQGDLGANAATLTSVVANTSFQNNAYAALRDNTGSAGLDNRPITRAQVISYAHYYSGKELEVGGAYGFSDATYTARLPLTGLRTAADQYASGVPASMATALQWVKDDLTGPGSHLAIFNSAGQRYQNWDDLAVTWGKELAFYEGNLEICAPSSSWAAANFGDASYGGTDGKIQRLIDGFRASDRYKETALLYWAAQTSRASPTTRYPAIYAWCGPEPWTSHPAEKAGAIPNYGNSEAPAYKVFDAMVAFNHDTPAVVTANDDAYSMAFDAGPLPMDLIANDVGSGLFISNVTIDNPSMGTVIRILGNSKAQYTKAVGFSGVASGTYTISDGDTTDDGAWQVTVAAAPPPPAVVAVDDTYSMAFAAPPLTMDVLSNDLNGPNVITAVTIDSPTMGSIARINSNTRAQYTKAGGFSGLATGTYTASNGLTSSTGRWSVNVAPDVPPPPAVVAVDDSYSVLFNTAPLTMDVLANDQNGPNVITDATIDSPLMGTIARVNGNTRLVFTKPLGFSGLATGTYTASNGLTTSLGHWSVNVAPEIVVPPPPVTAAPDVYTQAFETTSIDMALLANDTTATSISAIDIDNPAWGSVARIAGNTKARFTKAPGFKGVATGTYTATDGVTSATSRWSVTVRKHKRVRFIQLPQPT